MSVRVEAYNPSMGRSRQKGQKFKVRLDYIIKPKSQTFKRQNNLPWLLSLSSIPWSHA